MRDWDSMAFPMSQKLKTNMIATRCVSVLGFKLNGLDCGHRPETHSTVPSML